MQQNNAHNMLLHMCVCIHIIVYIILIFISIPLYAHTICGSTNKKLIIKVASGKEFYKEGY